MGEVVAGDRTRCKYSSDREYEKQRGNDQERPPQPCHVRYLSEQEGRTSDRQARSKRGSGGGPVRRLRPGRDDSTHGRRGREGNSETDREEPRCGERESRR